MARAARDAAQPLPAPKRRRRRLHIPTSVALTLGGAILTVLILPAFTRQWDDRQKARELQAALAQDVAASTAKAVGDALAVLTGSESRNAPALAGEWERVRSRLEATLRVYYPPSVIARWYETSENVADLHRIAPDCRKLVVSAVGKPRYYGISFEGELAFYLTDLFYERSAGYYREPAGAYDRSRGQAEKYAKWVIDVRNVRPPLDFLATLLRRLYTRKVDRTLRDIMETTPQSFSTTRVDLIRDILPGI
jgi:hypothetical protein